MTELFAETLTLAPKLPSVLDTRTPTRESRPAGCAPAARGVVTSASARTIARMRQQWIMPSYGYRGSSRGVGADPAPMADPVDQNAGEQRPQPSAHEKVDVPDVAQDSTAEDCMRKSVADIAHAAQNDIDADEAAERADDDRGDEAVAKEFVLEWD